jgi:4-hydroxy-2-oxoheptanedioate aldolase
MINNKKEAEQFVSFMKYPPLGNRSFGPTRQNIISGKNYYSNANDNVLCIAMIETEEAMKNLNEIISTDGLDAVYIGPADLTLGTTQGRLPPGIDREEEEMIERIKTILSKAKKAEKKACLHCVKTSYAIEAVKWGFDLVTLNSDTRLLASSASNSINEFRNGVK